MGKALAGVKYGNMTSGPKVRPHSKGGKKMTGRSGPPMVSIGSPAGRKGTSQTARTAGKGFRFAKTGSVAERNSSGTNTGNTPNIGNQRGRSGAVGPFK